MVDVKLLEVLLLVLSLVILATGCGYLLGLAVVEYRRQELRERIKNDTSRQREGFGHHAHGWKKCVHWHRKEIENGRI